MEKHKMKKTLKIIYAAIAGIVTIIITFLLISNKKKKSDVAKIDKQIDDNNAIVNNAQGHIEAIKEQKEDVKEAIETREHVIENLKEQKENIQPETPKTVADAKENIVNKTKRKGRKPRK